MSEVERYKIVKRIMDQESAIGTARDLHAVEAHEGFDVFLKRLRSIHGEHALPGAMYCFEVGFKYAMALASGNKTEGAR